MSPSSFSKPLPTLPNEVLLNILDARLDADVTTFRSSVTKQARNQVCSVDTQSLNLSCFTFYRESTFALAEINPMFHGRVERKMSEYAEAAKQRFQSADIAKSNVSVYCPPCGLGWEICPNYLHWDVCVSWLAEYWSEGCLWGMMHQLNMETWARQMNEIHS